MSPTEFAKAHTKHGVGTDLQGYHIEVLQDSGVKGLPSCEELHKLIAERVFPQDEDYSLSPEKTVRQDINAKIDKVEDEPAVAVEEPTEETIEENTKKMIAKFTSKELKKNPLKIAKKELNDKGDEVEAEVEVAFPYVAGFDYSSTYNQLR